MDMQTKNGKPVTDKMLDEWANSFESGEWPEGKTVILGRPRLSTEEVQSVTVKLPRSKVLALEAKAAGLGFNRSEALRAAIDEFIAST
ncbi:MAG: ribbon-helix-helix domain-containing protein [Coriobacteriia bacterium]|nr:ribbon-helix-helix domain-containing protein [Coriobacteriia bacterium]